MADWLEMTDITEEDLMGLEEFMPRAEDVEGFVHGRQEAMGGTNIRQSGDSLTASTRGRNGSQDSSRYGGKGWNARKTFERKSKQFADELYVKDEEVLVKFLQDSPFWTYYRHWINAAPGQKSFTCLQDDCPLCEIDSPRLVSMFNIVDLSDTKNPTVKVWITSSQPTAAIVKLDEDPKYSPINREDMYFALSRSRGSNGFYSYRIMPVKARDLQDDYGMDALSQSDIAKFLENAYDENILRVVSRAELEEIVKSLS